MKAIGTTGKLGDPKKLILDEAIPIQGNDEVRVIIPLPEENVIDEREWLSAGSKNSAFDFLNDPQEDIHTIEDGKPI